MHSRHGDVTLVHSTATKERKKRAAVRDEDEAGLRTRSCGPLASYAPLTSAAQGARVTALACIY